MWYRNVSICFIFVYYVFIFSLNVIIGKIIDYILMRVILLWWIYNYIIKYRICIYLGVIFFNFLKLFFFWRGLGGGGEYILNIIMYLVEKVIVMYMFWKGNSILGIFICWNCLSKIFFCFGFFLRWFYVDIVL